MLSFPWEDKKFYKGKINKKNIYLGDLAISYNYIKKQEENFEVYLKKIMIHGFLHLIGYDHDNKKNYLKMEEKQKKILTL
ncbi:MAG: rRNA maturation RNase YbeY [Candidatus Pelagibacter sp.]|nr:rRNA maturation RNase YbeY [Candidatus Pelagibacter sp.]OUV98072.1 MAG: rRNA maturation RNase YbeY [Candidatus Pelagibacter sp. TMED142]